MAGFTKSKETITTTFAPSGVLEENVVNLTKGQNWEQCAPWPTQRFTSNGAGAGGNLFVSVEMFNNGGVAAARIRRLASGAAGGGNVTVHIDIVEFGDEVTVQRGSVSLTSQSATAALDPVVLDDSFILISYHTASVSGTANWGSQMVQASFNSTTQAAFERRLGGNPDWELYWYVISSNGIDFKTEYLEVVGGSADTEETTTLSNTVDPDHAFLVCTYEVGESADDMRDGILNFAITDPDTLTRYRNNGGSPDADYTIGIWVVRTNAAGAKVQRFAIDVDGQLTTNQTIDTVDVERALVSSSQHVAGGAWPINSSLSGGDSDNYQHSLELTSAINLAAQRFSDTALDGSNNNIRAEVIELGLVPEGRAGIVVERFVEYAQ